MCDRQPVQQNFSSARKAAEIFTVLKILAGMKPPPPIATIQSVCETKTSQGTMQQSIWRGEVDILLICHLLFPLVWFCDLPRCLHDFDTRTRASIQGAIGYHLD
jgi:hypothetical protein